MNFKAWFEERNTAKIYLDLDGTLVCYDGDKPILRPNVHKFIDALKKIAPTEILTHSTTEDKKRLVKKLNINLPVIGKDEYSQVKSNPHNILVDDTPASNHRTQAKLKVLGIHPDRLIHIKSCKTNLMDLVSKIKHLVHMNEWVEKTPQKLPNKQPFHTYDKAKKLAKEREDKFYEGMKEAGKGFQVETDIKKKSSFVNKTVDRGKEPDRVYDVLRGAILVDEKSQIDKVVDNLKKIFLIKKVEHKVKPEFFGYYGATHVDVVINDMICEIQVMTKKLWKYKMKADEIYQKYRGTEKPPKEEVEKSRKLFKIANGD